MTRSAMHAGLAIILLATSCAQAGGGQFLPAPLDSAVEAYSRNQIVCAPTAAGNLLGTAVSYVFVLVASPVTVPLVLLYEKRHRHDRARDEHSGLAIAGLSVLLLPVYLFGGIVGTPSSRSRIWQPRSAAALSGPGARRSWSALTDAPLHLTGLLRGYRTP